jgi:hypothetical protein
LNSNSHPTSTSICVLPQKRYFFPSKPQIPRLVLTPFMTN